MGYARNNLISLDETLYYHLIADAFVLPGSGVSASTLAQTTVMGLPPLVLLENASPPHLREDGFNRRIDWSMSFCKSDIDVPRLAISHSALNDHTGPFAVDRIRFPPFALDNFAF